MKLVKSKYWTEEYYLKKMNLCVNANGELFKM